MAHDDLGVPPQGRWWQHAVTYQVYVRSFADGDGDGVGDLEGLRRRLPHLDALGVDAIWLNPVYPSPQRDHGYDVADYLSIDPAYGDLDTFDRLVADARDRGIRVLMDVVPNHCSDAHPWFRAALAAGPGSPERARFYFRDGRGPDGAEPPNDWTAIFGGSAWTRVTEPDGRPGQWYLGVFTPHQPDLDWSNPEVAEHFDRVLTFWFDRGVEGFRADAVTHLGKADGLPDLRSDVPFGRTNEHYTHQPSGHAAWRRWRQLVDGYSAAHPGRDLFVIAEAYTPRRPDVLTQYVNADEFHQGFGFDLTLSPWRAADLRRAIDDTARPLLAQGTAPAWTLNNHDVQRSTTRYGRADATEPRDITQGNLVHSDAPVDVALGTRRSAAAALLVLALPGSVFLYAGEELGLWEVLDLPDEARQDPIFALTGGAQAGRDGCRVPLPWTIDRADAHGFSPPGTDTRPWLPQPDGWGSVSAEAQDADPSSTLALYRDAVRLRRKLTDLAEAPLEWLDAGADALAFRRGDVLVVLNAGRGPLDVPPALRAGRHLAIASDPSSTEEVVAADSCAWLTG